MEATFERYMIRSTMKNEQSRGLVGWLDEFTLPLASLSANRDTQIIDNAVNIYSTLQSESVGMEELLKGTILQLTQINFEFLQVDEELDKQIDKAFSNYKGKESEILDI